MRLALKNALLAVLAAATLLNVCALIVGQPPLDVYALLYRNTLASPYGFSQVLFKASPLILLGVAASIAFSAGNLNIGLEGQLIMGSLMMGVLGTLLPAAVPGALGTLLIAASGALAGGAYAALPAWLKLRFKAPEVMTSIMLNFIAAFAANFTVRFFAVSESTHTPAVPLHFMLTSAAGLWPAAKGTQLGSSLLVAVLVAGAAAWLLFRTRTGFDLRALGDNPRAAALYGVRARALLVLSFATSGAVAGLAAMCWVLGAKGYHEDGFSGGIGFSGVAVALLARNHPLAVLPAALLFGLLSYGSLAINTLVPKEMTDVLVATVMMFMLVLGARPR